MRVPSSKGISPITPTPARETVPPSPTPTTRAQRDLQDNAENSSVEVQLSSQAESLAKYLRLLKAMPDVREDRVAQVRAKLAQQSLFPSTELLAGAVIAQHLGDD
ncbi:flagellar biosynthesis anti-sigma factor FlgM [Candidatus Poribacteria bacterium]|nr:flagellar biosynthesis anti-sigma factor FlgM [Candidatus Poribacteria bacterium]